MLMRLLGAMAVALILMSAPHRWAQAADGMTFPGGIDDYFWEFGYFASINESYYATERTPVFARPSATGEPIYFLPPNGRRNAMIIGISDGWGVFSRMIDPHDATLWYNARDFTGQFGWIEMKNLRVGGTPDSRCKDRRIGNGDIGYEYPLDARPCMAHLQNISGETVLEVFTDQKALPTREVGQIRKIGLNKCVIACRDDKACGGFVYDKRGSVCSLRSELRMERSADGKDIVGAKLVWGQRIPKPN